MNLPPCSLWTGQYRQIHADSQRAAQSYRHSDADGHAGWQKICGFQQRRQPHVYAAGRRRGALRGRQLPRSGNVAEIRPLCLHVTAAIPTPAVCGATGLWFAGAAYPAPSSPPARPHRPLRPGRQRRPRPAERKPCRPATVPNCRGGPAYRTWGSRYRKRPVRRGLLQRRERRQGPPPGWSAGIPGLRTPPVR